MNNALSINPRFDFDNNKWLADRFQPLRGLREFVKRHWAYKAKDVNSVAKANAHIADIESRVKRCDLNLAADDDEFQDFAAAKARQCERMVQGAQFPALLVEGFLQQYGIVCEEMNPGRYKKGPLRGQVKPGKNWEARVSAKKWWLGKVRKLSARVCEQVCREVGQTHKKAGVYISDFGLQRWAKAQKRNAALLEKMECENDQGQIFTVAELAELGNANPIIRRGELMVRIRGFEEWAGRDSRDWAPLFLTLTCPSKYHAVHSWGGENRKYQGATPADAQAYLNGVWQRARAELARWEIPYFGFRVAEPHHDGCPHWHMLLFVEDAGLQKEILHDVIKEYALQEDGTEPGAEERRFTCVEIDSSKGTAAGYIAKYIAKNIDGFAVGQDYDAERPAIETAMRVQAWASVWGIRQFQQIAGPQVSIYRELRRLANHPEAMPVASGVEPENYEFDFIKDAADRADWAEFTERMGGAVCKRAERPLSIWRRLGIRKVEAENGKKDIAPKVGFYGEAVTEIRGLWSWWMDLPITTRFRDWVVRFKSEVAAATAQKQAPPACA